MASVAMVVTPDVGILMAVSVGVVSSKVSTSTLVLVSFGATAISVAVAVLFTVKLAACWIKLLAGVTRVIVPNPAAVIGRMTYAGVAPPRCVNRKKSVPLEWGMMAIASVNPVGYPGMVWLSESRKSISPCTGVLGRAPPVRRTS